MKIRAKAPLRLGIAGGGTDVSPYSDLYGGCVLNATINMYAYTHLEVNPDSNLTVFEASDLDLVDSIAVDNEFNINGILKLHRAVYKRVMDEFNNSVYLPLKVTTFSDAPPGSGLGTSSTIVVSMLEAYKQLLSLPLGEYDLAHLAYEIERLDCGLSGGKQDQYAATFGGFNFMEFYDNDRVIVNPLRIRRYIINELESSLLLYFTGKSRDSAQIIEDQINSINVDDDGTKLNSMHLIKSSAYILKELLFKANIDGMANEFKNAWISKKSTSKSITNINIDNIESALISNGAKSMKVSGAGGGGFIMIFIEPEKRNNIIRCLKKFDGTVQNFQFTEEGAHSWTI